MDKDGRKVFSDRQPPIDVPQKNILKQPGTGKQRSQSVPVPAEDQAQAGASAAPAASAASAPQASGKDKKLEEAKTKADAEEAAKKKAEADRVAKARAENCARAQKSKTSLTSGGLIGTVNDKGERGFMDDATREAEIKRADSVIASDCGTKPTAE
ncbi:hypothetical protein SDC9_212900 [bioreactor metagenome]|uniref:DUF4124 domain-containing protein n=1 Tax=bioreactor metagenome TaxID=1076179 RepID=A0A645JNB1_9ZZZZ